MNERIKELIKEAGTDISGKWMYTSNVEKYTELVVNELVDVVLEWKSEPFPLDPDFAAKIIKDHFGVK